MERFRREKPAELLRRNPNGKIPFFLDSPGVSAAPAQLALAVGDVVQVREREGLWARCICTPCVGY